MQSVNSFVRWMAWGVALGAVGLLARPAWGQTAPPPAEESAAGETTASVPDMPAAAIADFATGAPTTQPDAAPAASAPAPVAQVSGGNRGDQFVFSDVHIKETELAAALRMLTLQTKDNVIFSSKVDASQKVEANLYNVTFEQVLSSLLTPLGLTHQRQGNFIYIYTVKELEERKAKERQAASQIFKLNYVTAADAAVLIKPLLSQSGQVAVTAAPQTGISKSPETTGGVSYATEDALVVADYPENLRQIEKAIRMLDVRPRQVLIEATILRATLNEDNTLGVDFNALGGIDFASLTATTADSSGGDDSSSSTATSSSYPGNATSVDGNMTRPDFNNTTFNIKTDFLDPALFPKGGFSFGFIKNNVAAFVRALEEVTDTTVVANPKILALNKQKGEIIVGRRDGYLTTIQTDTQQIQKVEFLETGVQMIFRPFIAKDGYVRLELHPEDSSGALTAANLPFEETTEVTTNVMVKDGHTIVIGGLFREQTKSARAQVPWLGNLPYAGVLFRRKADDTVREEVIILLTVHIIEDNQAYAEVGEQVLQDVEKIRVGLRQNLMPHGRERLAQAHYKRSLELLDAGNTDKALWELDMALHLQPRFTEAINLRIKLTNERAWDGNGSLIHNFIYNRLIGAEDRWIDSLGREHHPLGPAPDLHSSEWGQPVRSIEQGSLRSPTTQPDDDGVINMPSPMSEAMQPTP
ncbi:MAG: hypothetical protein BIFFINMI_01618 [Phycisphaerae bacterium]|nr:hypothetical protein [Phycisphaerae bacterium]